MLQGKKIVITGGGGFIGSALAKFLAKTNELLLVDQSFNDNAFRYMNLNNEPKVQVVNADVLDAVKMKELISGCELIIHAAAILGVNRVRTQGRLTLETNFQGTKNLLSAAVDAGSVERFLFLSTSEIFGPSCFRVSEDGGISLKSVSEARWCYLISKLAGENLVRSYNVEFGLPVTIIRPFNIYGPGRVGDHVLKHFVRNALEERPIVIHGDGTQIRSWCYITDLVDAVAKALSNTDTQSTTFNIGNPRSTLTIYDLALRVLQQTKSCSEVHFEHPEFVDIDIRVPTIDKAKRELGFEPKVGIDEGIGHTVNWIKQTMKADEQQVDSFVDFRTIFN